MKSDAEFYVGIAGLTPPQSIAILFQIVDGGTANPLAPEASVPAYFDLVLSRGQPVGGIPVFPRTRSLTRTGELLDSTELCHLHAVPAEATSDNHAAALPGHVLDPRRRRERS